MQAVCLGFVHIPYIGPIPLQIVQQQLVQRCKTHIEAQSCKASYDLFHTLKGTKTAIASRGFSLIIQRIQVVTKSF